jgi:hypothetical protein
MLSRRSVRPLVTPRSASTRSSLSDLKIGYHQGNQSARE